jgi:hypothetical protein
MVFAAIMFYLTYWEIFFALIANIALTEAKNKYGVNEFFQFRTVSKASRPWILVSLISQALEAGYSCSPVEDQKT